MNHTPEPWAFHNESTISNERGRVLWLSLTDYQRARECVNACAGIKDPAEAIAEVREAINFTLAHHSINPEACLNWLNDVLTKLGGNKQ